MVHFPNSGGRNMKRLRIRHRSAQTIACGIISLLAVLGLRQLQAQGVKTQYPRMAPIEQYLMEKNAEIALARSAAPEAISRDATVLVLGPRGYETAVQGKNGFVCMVERGLVGVPDMPEFWNPKIRGADCLNPPAARSILPLDKIRTEMALAGRTPAEIVDRMRAALSSGEVPALEPGAMSYMMSKGSYLTDEDNHNGAHLMFFMPIADPTTWGASLPGSPVWAVSYWFFSEKTSSELNGLPPISIFSVGVGKWSDGTAASMH
jgi:hypothetical protein